MERQTSNESVEGVGAALCEVGAEAVAAHVFHFVFVRERGDGMGGELLAKGLVEEDKVGEASADAEGGLFEGCEIALVEG